MRCIKPLDALLPKTRQGILATLLVQPEKEWYVSELARRLGVPSSSLHRELEDLTAAGILKTRRRGRMVYCQADSDSPIFPDLRGLMLKTAGLVDILAEALKPLVTKLRVVFVYGPIASGSEQSGSHIDLMVVGDIEPSDFPLPLGRAEELLGREIKAMVYTLWEFALRSAAKDYFTGVLARPKLFVLGNEQLLRKLEV
jgi:DNA-binding transcriptional ArsR family regulator